MKRDWAMIERVLADIEAERTEDVANTIADDDECEKYLRHLELLVDCGYVMGVDISFTRAGYRLDLNHPRLTMAGYDFKDILQDKKLWNAIKRKAQDGTMKLSWEFIKAAVPVVLKELLK